MSGLRWALATERAAGMGGAFTDTLNRALRDVLSQSGYDPDAATFPGLRGPVFNVKSFGAKGDGVTVDTVAIHAAKDAASAAGGGVVHFPSGTYISDPDTLLLRLDKSNVFYVGEGAVIKRKSTSASTDLCFFGDPVLTITNTGITGLKLDGNRANTTPAGAGVVLFGKNLDGFYLGDIEVRNGPFFGFHFQTCINGVVGRVYTHHHNRDGFTWSEGCAYVAIGQVVSKYTGDDGMAFNQQTGAAVHDITVASYVSFNSGFNSDGTGPGGFGLKFSGNVHHIVVNGAQIDSPADTGIGFVLGFGGTGSPSYCSVTGRVTGAGQRVAAANRNGLLISGAANNIRATLDIDSGLNDGVVVNSSCTDIHLDVTSDSNAGAGVKLDGTGARLGRIEAKVAARNNGASGILALTIDRLVLHTPICTDNGTAGGVGTALSSGINIQDVTTFSLVGGVSSQWNTGAANKQTYGLSLAGTACGDVDVTGHTASVATAANAFFIQTLPTGTYKFQSNNGFNLNGKDVLRFMAGVGSFRVDSIGTGSPEGVVTGAPGSTFLRTDGAAGSMHYVKVTGTGNAGWTPVMQLDASGFVVASGGFRISLDGWQQLNTAASLAGAAMPRTPIKYTVLRSGSITGLIAKDLTGVTAGGTCTIEVYKNNVATGFTAVIAIGASLAISTQARGVLPVAAGDVITLGITTPVGWTSTTHTVTGTLELEQ